jgi:hypothetical protein
MTKRQRAQVVELLRCAADVCAIDSGHGLYSVAHLLGFDTWDSAFAKGNNALAYVWDQACQALNHVHADGYWHECLEAAQRVEEGTWP